MTRGGPRDPGRADPQPRFDAGANARAAPPRLALPRRSADDTIVAVARATKKGKPRDASRTGRWLLLIHQLPPEPAYLRVKVRRQLQRIGAQPLKNSVYVLPNRGESLEDFHWLRRSILDAGGEATVTSADFLEGTSDHELEDRFRKVSREAYADFVKAARRAATDGGERELEQLRSHLADLTSRDYFDAPGRGEAERTLSQVVAARSRDALGVVSPGEEPPAGATWVTRADVHVDRMASAWLIRRFIDPGARFRFVGDPHYKPRRGERRFDMFEGEYTHEGDRCTFQTLLARFGLSQPALAVIGEIVHDIDYKIQKSSRPETSSVQFLIRGICLARERDEDRLDAARELFDGLYATFERDG